MYECRKTREMWWTFIFRSQMLITIVVVVGGGDEECMRSFRPFHITAMVIAHEHIPHTIETQIDTIAHCVRVHCYYLSVWQVFYADDIAITYTTLTLLVIHPFKRFRSVRLQPDRFLCTQCACASNRVDFVHSTKQCLHDRSPSCGIAATIQSVGDKSLQTTHYKTIVIHSVTFGMVYAEECARVCGVFGVWNVIKHCLLQSLCASRLQLFFRYI